MFKKLLWARRTIQSFMLLVLGQWSFYGIFRCPFAVPFISCESCPVITCMGRWTSLFWGFWLLLPLSALLVGRAFCGWLCPGGMVNQLVGALTPFRQELKGKLAKLAPYGKYLAIPVVLYLFYGLGNPRWAIPIRTAGDFTQAVQLTFEHASHPWMIRTLVVLAMVFTGFWITNLWCRFACPTGGLLELFKRFSLFRFFRNEKCNDCQECLHACPMGTRPAEHNCTNCGDCLNSCPINAIDFGRGKRSH
jgi:polyferredoxin